MRFIARSAGFKCFPVHQELDELTMRVRKQGVIAAFRANQGLHPWEEEAARAQFRFPGGNLEDDGDAGGAPVDPIGRVSLYDTDAEAAVYGWDSERKQQVEEAMLKISSQGNGQDFIMVSKPPTAKPWPSYDDFLGEGIAAKIAAFTVEAGLDPAAVIAYEEDNKNRKTVLAALQAIEQPEIVTA